jgi:hypothetical protein
MTKGKTLPSWLLNLFNGHDAAGPTGYRLSIPHRRSKIPLGLILIPTSKLICVALEFD